MWIESHQSIRNHPKIKKAARLCGVNEFEMIGRLHCLWWWALDYAPDGDVTKYSADDIESAVDWNGKAGVFYAALIECGFNGHCGFLEMIDSQITIHDWHEYGGRLLEKREANRERMREKRATHVQDTTVARTGATEQNRTEQTEQTEQTEPIKRAAQPLSTAAQVYIDAGGKFPSGKLKDGSTKKSRAIEYISSKISEDRDSLEFFRQVVEAYCLRWSSRSYTVMVDEYYLEHRLPGQKNGQGSKNGNTPRCIEPDYTAEELAQAERINAARHAREAKL
jgi:hypothetical protein